MIHINPQILHHNVIVKNITPKAPAVIALVHQVNAMAFFGKVFGMGFPVVSHSQKAVQYDPMIVSCADDVGV